MDTTAAANLDIPGHTVEQVGDRLVVNHIQEYNREWFYSPFTPF